MPFQAIKAICFPDLFVNLKDYYKYGRKGQGKEKAVFRQ